MGAENDADVPTCQHNHAVELCARFIVTLHMIWILSIIYNVTWTSDITVKKLKLL